MRFVSVLVALGLVLAVEPAAYAKKHKVHHTTARSVKSSKLAKATSAKRAARSVPTPTAKLASLNGTGISNELANLVYPNASTADVAVFAKSMNNGQVLYARNTSEPLTPASTMKILTAGAALIYLGGDYRFSTQLLTDAKSVKNGVLQGNLYIVLSGDPTLTYDDLIELMSGLQSHQIQAISGNVYIDNTAYDQRFYGPGWVVKDKNYCYGAPISASIINKNCLPLKIVPSKVSGNPAQVTTSPNFFYPDIRNGVVTTAGRNRQCGLKLSTNPGSTISLDGCMSKGNYAWGLSYVVTDVPEYNRSLFKNLLARLDVDVYGNVTFGSAPDKLYVVNVHNSDPLRDLIHDMLKKSDNIIAASLFKKLGQLYTHQQGSWETGAQAVTQILSRYARVDVSGMKILDGSGLSPDNLATASQMMQLLDYAIHTPKISDDFYSALPIGGIDGTLKHRLGNIPRRVHAKTGTISGVNSLAGYVTTRDNQTIGFVILVNGRKSLGWKYKAMEDKIVTALSRYNG